MKISKPLKTETLAIILFFVLVIVAASFLSFKQKDIAESTADLLIAQNGTPKTRK